MGFAVRIIAAVILAGTIVAGPMACAQTIVTLGAGFALPHGGAIDSHGNVFIINVSDVEEILAVNGVIPPEPSIVALGDGFFAPHDVKVDAAGNVFVADFGNDAVKEIVAVNGVIPALPTIHILGGGFSGPNGVAVDGAGNVFVADTFNNAVKEIVAVNGVIPAQPTILTLGSGFKNPVGVAVDRSGNVFVADTATVNDPNTNDNAIKEIVALNGVIPAEPTILTLGGGFAQPGNVAVDGTGNVFVADFGDNTVKEIVAVNGTIPAEPTILTLGSGFNEPQGVAVDGGGNVFVADTGNEVVKEIQAGSPVLVASVLPGSRSVAVNAPATIFATMINTGPGALDNCQVTLPAFATTFGGIFSYQTTDPKTNMPTGTPNTPVTIAGQGGSQSFILSFQSDFFTGNAPDQQLDFNCTLGAVSQVAADIIGVDTVDLVFSQTPIADIIALAATPTQPGIIAVPNGGAAAFAVATSNAGAAGDIIASVDTGGTNLPVVLSICQSNPSNGQCLAPPAPTVALNFAAGATPTFSVFLQATGPIPFAPGSARVFLRFEDSSGGLHGSTSVAVETN